MAKTNNGLVAVAVFLGITALTPAASARDQLRIVGSSTVYPFTTAVAEQFGKATGARTPVIESTGTGGGMKIFCEGIGVDKVDVTNASRRMEKGEFDACQKNGVTEIIEVNIGFDGLTMAQSKTGAPMKLTLAQVFLALAEQVPAADGKLVANPHKLWSDIDRSLPNHKIEVLGAADVGHARSAPRALPRERRRADPGAQGAQVRRSQGVREDLEIDPPRRGLCRGRRERQRDRAETRDQQGCVGRSATRSSRRMPQSCAGSPSTTPIRPSRTSPTGSTRAPGACTYFKKQHFGVIPGLDKFMAQYVSEKTLGQDGALARKGLVPLPKAEFEAMRKAALAGETTKADADQLGLSGILARWAGPRRPTLATQASPCARPRACSRCQGLEAPFVCRTGFHLPPGIEAQAGHSMECPTSPR